MSTAIQGINFLGVIAAAAVCFVLGSVYFGVLMTRHYAAALGREGLPAAKPTALVVVGPFVCNVVMIVTTAALLRLTGVTSLGETLAVGAVVGIGYLVPMCITIAINPNFPKPFSYVAINAPYFLTNILVTTAILFAVA